MRKCFGKTVPIVLILLKQHSKPFEIWSAIIRINTDGKSLIMKLGPVLLYGLSFDPAIGPRVTGLTRGLIDGNGFNVILLFELCPRPYMCNRMLKY